MAPGDIARAAATREVDVAFRSIFWKNIEESMFIQLMLTLGIQLEGSDLMHSVKSPNSAASSL